MTVVFLLARHVSDVLAFVNVFIYEIKSYTKIWESRESLVFARKNGRG